MVERQFTVLQLKNTVAQIVHFWLAINRHLQGKHKWLLQLASIKLYIQGTNLKVKIKRAKRQTLRGNSTKIRLNQHYINYHYMLKIEKVLKEPFVVWTEILYIC